MTSSDAAEVLRRVDAEGVYVTPVARPEVLLFRPHDGSQAVVVVESDALTEAGRALHWAFDGNGFYYLATGQRTAIRYFDLTAKDERDVYEAGEGTTRTLTVSPDGRWLLFDLEQHGGLDVVLIDPFVESVP